MPCFNLLNLSVSCFEVVFRCGLLLVYSTMIFAGSLVDLVVRFVCFEVLSMRQCLIPFGSVKVPYSVHF